MWYTLNHFSFTANNDNIQKFLIDYPVHDFACFQKLQHVHYVPPSYPVLSIIPHTIVRTKFIRAINSQTYLFVGEIIIRFPIGTSINEYGAWLNYMKFSQMDVQLYNVWANTSAQFKPILDVSPLHQLVNTTRNECRILSESNECHRPLDIIQDFNHQNWLEIHTSRAIYTFLSFRLFCNENSVCVSPFYPTILQNNYKGGIIMSNNCVRNINVALQLCNYTAKQESSLDHAKTLIVVTDSTSRHIWE